MWLSKSNRYFIRLVTLTTWSQLLVLRSTGLSNDDDQLVIETTKGKVRGFTGYANTPDRLPVDMWYGIPYAEPPLDNLRFTYPVPIKSWSGIKDTKELPNSCPQIIDTFFPGSPGAEMWNPNTELSEDCLFLNIAVPSNRPRSKRAAVMVWIYGGGFYSGTSTLEMYDPRTLAVTEEVIVVAIQYRVASLGFLYLGSDEAPGNAGLFDQRLALEFIKGNIQNFGGDPENITLFGQDAGAVSISLHLRAPHSRHLFNRGILQSGSSTMSWATISSQESMDRGLQLASAVNCPNDKNNTSEVLACLRKVNPASLVAAEWGTLGICEFPFVPILEGHFFHEPADDSFPYKQTPLLVGSNLNEGNYFLLYYLLNIYTLAENVQVDREDFLAAVRELNPYLNRIARQAVIFEYTDWLNPHDPIKNRENLDYAVGDEHFTCDLNEIAFRFAEAGNYVYYYHFTHRSSQHFWPGWTGVMHGDEIKFVFGEPLDPNKDYTPEEIDLSRLIMRYWANFAKTGNPSLYSNGTWSKTYWPVHTVFGREYLVLSLNTTTSSPTIGHGPRLKQCAFWKKYLPQLSQATAGMMGENQSPINEVAEGKLCPPDCPDCQLPDFRDEAPGFATKLPPIPVGLSTAVTVAIQWLLL